VPQVRVPVLDPNLGLPNSAGTCRRHMAKSERLPPIHPGEILREDFMAPFGISMNRLALDLRGPVTRIDEIHPAQA